MTTLPDGEYEQNLRVVVANANDATTQHDQLELDQFIHDAIP